MTPLISFFIPCLNEEGNISRAIDTLVSVMRELGHSYEVLVIDDASQDGSVAEVLDRARRYPEARITVLQNPFCRGLGRNYFIAAHRAAGQYFMLVNGDAAEPVESIRTILSHLGEADAIVPYFGAQDHRSWARKTLSRCFTWLVNLLSGYRLKYYNGPALHKTENVRLWFAETAGFGYQAELLCRLLGEGISVLEVAVPNIDRAQGVSKAFTFGNVLAVSNTLFHIFLRRLEMLSIRRFPPVRSSGVTGWSAGADTSPSAQPHHGSRSAAGLEGAEAEARRSEVASS